MAGAILHIVYACRSDNGTTHEARRPDCANEVTRDEAEAIRQYRNAGSKSVATQPHAPALVPPNDWWRYDGVATTLLYAAWIRSNLNLARTLASGDEVAADGGGEGGHTGEPCALEAHAN